MSILIDFKKFTTEIECSIPGVHTVSVWHNKYLITEIEKNMGRMDCRESTWDEWFDYSSNGPNEHKKTRQKQTFVKALWILEVLELISLDFSRIFEST